MLIVQLLLALALLSSSGSSNYAIATQQEINQPQPQAASQEHVMESGLKPFRPQSSLVGFDPDTDPIEHAASMLEDKLYQSVVSPILSKPGDTGTFDYGGHLKLLKSVPLNARFERGPLTIHVVHAQLLEASDIPEDSRNNISILNREDIGSKITYINILYTVENTTDQNIGFYGLNSVHPNTGKPISADRNFMRKSYVYNQYDGVVIDNTSYGLVYTDDPDELESIELVFNKIYDYDTGKTIIEPTSLNIPFAVQQ